MAFPGGTLAKNPLADAASTGLIPGSARAPGIGITTHSNNFALRIPRTEEPGGIWSMGLRRARHGLVTEYAHVI